MDRREMMVTTGLGVTGFAIGSASSAPACGVSKEKAVRVASLVVELVKVALPLLDLLGAPNIANTVRDKVIPTLEKLKDALGSVDLPNAATTLETVRAALSSVGTALLALPDSPRRTTIIGILASVNALLLTVEAFVESETDQPQALRTPAARTSSKPISASIWRVYEASKS